MYGKPTDTTRSLEPRVGPFVLEGNAILCQCPTCGSPMSVRLWLMEAECWQCATRIEISEAQRAALEDLIEKQKSAASFSPPSPVQKVTIGGKTIRLDPPQPREPAQAPILPSKPLATPQATPQATPRATVKPKPLLAPPIEPESIVLPAPVSPVLSPASPEQLVRHVLNWLDSLPAWLISLLFHLMLLLLLAILSVEEVDDRGIILSLAVSSERKPGDIQSFVHSERSFEMPLPKHLNPDDPKDQGVIEKAQSLAGELAAEQYDRGFRPIDFQSLREKVHQPYETNHGLIARDVRMRKEMLQEQGGTLLTEAAVARALRWIADHQQSNGSWRLDSYSYGSGRGTLDSDPAATALALLPFLGAGQTHRSGIYRQQVRDGLQYLIQIQEPDGDLRGSTRGEAGMYVQGQAAIVLCEAFAMTNDESLRSPAAKAISFIAASQHSQGGWRYEPGMAGDTSVLGWQVMALQSAKMAGLIISDVKLDQANLFLDSVSSNRGSTYGYMPGHDPTPNMTAEALLCRMYLGADPNASAIRRGLRLLMRDFPPSFDHVDYYYWYYATQAFHHAGGEPWKRWNESLRDIIVSKQVASGKHAGSWEVEGHLADAGGRLYVTALATCTLEVYYRHLPLFNGKLEKQNE